MNAQKVSLAADTLFATSQQLGLEYVLKYNPDRFLAPAYNAMGITPKASTYGGWESQQIQGHMLGHYLSALSGFYYQTGSKDAKDKLEYTVSCIKEIQRGDGYFGGIPSTPFDTVFSSNGTFAVERFSLAGWWVPWYSVHKIYAGLLDAYTFGGNKDALEIVKKMADWAITGTSKMTDDQIQKMLTCEQGGMCKVFADLYGITKDERYLKEAERWINKEVIDPAIKEKDMLQGFHANTQIPKFIGIARLYELTGKTEYRTAAEFFFNTVTQRRSYVIGGNSRGEHFGKEYDEVLGRDTCETCNTYNMLELAEHIFSWNHDSYIADYYETALYNHILASQDPDSGAKTYFVSTQPGFYKVYGTHDNAMWCCTGTGIENPERYNRFIAKEYEGTLYVNLFIPATITTESGWKIQIDTSFPYASKASIKVLAQGKAPLGLKVRVPAWVEDVTSISTAAQKGKDGYWEVTPALTNGQTTVLELPAKITIRKARDHSGNFSILYGPIVLVADLGTKAMPVDIVDNQTVYMNMPAKKVSVITADLKTPEAWVTETDTATLTFTTKAEAAEDGTAYTLRPFYATNHTRYTVYFASTNAEQNVRVAKFENSTIDDVEPGRQQSEIDHHSKAEKSEMGYITSVDSSYRAITEAGGSFSYRLKFDTTKENKLVLTVYGKDKGSLTVTMDDKVIGTVTCNGDKGDSLVDIEVAVPKDMISGKNKSLRKIVSFSSADGNALRLLELRVIY